MRIRELGIDPARYVIGEADFVTGDVLGKRRGREAEHKRGREQRLLDNPLRVS